MTTKPQAITKKQYNELDGFVQAYLTELIQDKCQFEEDEQERKQQEQYMLDDTDYAEVTGTIDRFVFNTSDIRKHIGFWIGSHDEISLHIHLGGSACWIIPDNHYIHFVAIDPTLLPRYPNRNEWWAIMEGERDTQFTVYKISVTRESDVSENFPSSLH
jgi:hypothetical protein